MQTSTILFISIFVLVHFYSNVRSFSFIKVEKTLNPFALSTSASIYHVEGDTSRKSTIRIDSKLHQSSSSSSSGTNKKWDIIFEKIIRNVPLPLLIEYIRDSFEIPKDLAMPYQRVPNIDQVKKDDSSGGTLISAFQCSLDAIHNPSTLLLVEVVGIRVGDGDEDRAAAVIPSMAMVAIKKQRRETDEVNSSLKGLYEASEKQLIRELEMGMEDLVQSKGYKQKQKEDKMEQDDEESNVKLEEKQSEDEQLIEFMQKVQEQQMNDGEGDEEKMDDVIDVQSQDVTDSSNTDVEKEEVIISDEERERQKSLDSVFPGDIANIPITAEEEQNNEQIASMEDGVDITPQQLLDDVLAFGEEQSKEDKVGTSFATSAFETAKELLRDQQQTQVGTMEQEPLKENISDFMKVPSTNEDDAQEELRRIFAAGERLAETRLVVHDDNDQKSNTLSTSKTNNDDGVDALIDSDTTVPRTAKQLDEELAELEMRIGRTTPDEAPPSGNVFDIFSGPPSSSNGVDPAFDVNWPGAPYGSKTVNLPNELKEALQNAQFAAQTLTQIQEVKQDDGSVTYTIGNKQLTKTQVTKLQNTVSEAVSIGLIDDPLDKIAESSRLALLIDELRPYYQDRFEEIVDAYKDLLLSDHFISLVRDRLQLMADRQTQQKRVQGTEAFEEDAEDTTEREILSKLVDYSAQLLKEVRALGAELEAMQLEVIRSICRVAMNPKYQTEEEAAIALSDAARDMRPLLDDAFVSYLKYAIAEEEGRLARRALLDDPEHNAWLMVLKIVQSGVYAELATGINRYLEHIWYILRMKTRTERRMLLEKIVDVMPSMDVRPFVKTVENIVSSLGAGVRGDFDVSVWDDGNIIKALLQLSRDLKELLPPERIASMSRDADEWSRKRKETLLEQQKEVRERLKEQQQYMELGGEGTGDGSKLTSKRGEIERAP